LISRSTIPPPKSGFSTLVRDTIFGATCVILAPGPSVIKELVGAAGPAHQGDARMTGAQRSGRRFERRLHWPLRSPTPCGGKVPVWTAVISALMDMRNRRDHARAEDLSGISSLPVMDSHRPASGPAGWRFISQLRQRRSGTTGLCNLAIFRPKA
jgi:hypothetical protein